MQNLTFQQDVQASSDHSSDLHSSDLASSESNDVCENQIHEQEEEKKPIEDKIYLKKTPTLNLVRFPSE